MKPEEYTINASTISKSTRDWLFEPKPSRVLNVFKPVVNLAASDGRVVSLVSREIGNGPLNILLPEMDFSKIISVNTEIHLLPQRILLGSVAISTTKATIWQAIYPWQRFWHRQDKIEFAISILQEHLSSLEPSQNPQIIESLDSSDPINITKEMAANLSDNAASFCQSILQRNHQMTEIYFDHLCGKGIGLTPEGDDVLIGCLLALWATSIEDHDSNWLQKIAERAKNRTTTLSTAWLRVTARGECSEVWHHLLDAIMVGDKDKARISIQLILQQGFTSGRASLTGFQTGLEAFHIK